MSDPSRYEPYRAYVMDVSYFSGKLEAYLRYKEIPFERVETGTPELLDPIYTHTGLMKVPVVECANGQWLKDTTPMLYWFEQQYPSVSIIPADPYSHFLSRLVEDYADEWLWRPALYYRWVYPQDFRLLGDRIAREVMTNWPVPRLVGWYFGKRQQAVQVRGDGVRAHNEDYVKETYLNNINSLQSILESSSYLLGSHPSLVDFGYFASMFRHFGLDPTPAKIMRQQAPAVYEWLARLWNAKASHLPATQIFSDFSHAGWDWIFKDIGEAYLPYLADNAQAFAEGRKRFDFSSSTVSFPNLKVSQYRSWCRGELQRAYADLPEEVKARLAERLPFDLDALMQQHGIIESGLESEFDLPLQRSPRPARGLQRIKLMLEGTPQDMPKESIRNQ